MKSILVLFAMCFTGLVAEQASARTLVVDRSGLGQYTSIQAGINAALAGDTVKVYPGVYNEQITISTNIVLEGSGYEYTQIVANANPAVSISSGKMMWFAISSNVGDGVTMSGGVLTNCVIWNCISYGVTVPGGTSSIIQNCDIVFNNSGAVEAYVPNTASATFINDITFPLNSIYYNPTIWGGNSIYCDADQSGTGDIEQDPLFKSNTDFTLTGGSPCIDTGKPDIYDPDGSRSDMGYYGGPDAPVFPVVTNLRIYLNADGTVNVQATAQSRY